MLAARQTASSWSCPIADAHRAKTGCFPRTQFCFPASKCQKPRLRTQNSRGNKSMLENQKENSSIRF